MKPIKLGLACLLAAGLGVGVIAGTDFATAGSPTPALTFIANSRTLHPSVEIAGLSGSDPRRLGPGTSAVISPSGTSVAAVALVGPQSNTSSEVLVYPASGGAPKILYKAAGFMQLFGWSADSTRILVWVSGGYNHGPLLEIKVASGAATKLASGVIEGASFAPNSSGDVVFALAKSLLSTAPVNLFVNLPSGGPALQITTDGHDSSPVWGPHSIIFARSKSRGSQYAPINQLWSIAPSGGEATQLTHMSVGPLVDGLAPVAISANGSHLLAQFGGTDTAMVWVVNLTGAIHPRALLGVRTDGDIADAISRNGDTVLFTSGFEDSPTQLETIPWSGGKATVVAPHGAGGDWNY
jgi:Tol biopolymer transport system component